MERMISSSESKRRGSGEKDVAEFDNSADPNRELRRQSDIGSRLLPPGEAVPGFQPHAARANCAGEAERIAFLVSRWGQWGILALALTVELFQFGRSYDDAYITFVYARSLAAGEGFRWHGTEVLGTSAPWLALLLAALERCLPLGIPVWGSLLSTVAGVGSALCLFGWGRHVGWPVMGFWCGAAWLVWPGRWVLGGGEWPLTLLPILGARQAWVSGRLMRFGLLAGCATLLRPEAALAPALLALEGLLRAPRALLGSLILQLSRASVMAGLLVGSGWLLLRAVAGTVVPTTVAHKQAQADSVLAIWGQGTVVGHLEAVGTMISALPTAPAVALVALAALGVAASLKGRVPYGVVALLAWGVLHLFLLAALGLPPIYEWYRIPTAVALLVASAVGFAVFIIWIRGQALALAGIAWFVGIGIQAVAQVPRVEARALAAQELAAGLAAAPPGSRVAAYEVGYLGWYSSRPVVDLLGLVSPEVQPDLIRSGRLDLALERLGANYLVLREDGGKLLEAAVPRPEEFVRRWQLDRRIASSEGSYYLFRKESDRIFASFQGNPLARLAAQGVRIDWFGPPRARALAAELPHGVSVEYGLLDAAGELSLEAWSEHPGTVLEVDFSRSGETTRGLFVLSREDWTPLPIKIGSAMPRVVMRCHVSGQGRCAVVPR